MKMQNTDTRRRKNRRPGEAGSATIEQPANSPVCDGTTGPTAEMIGGGPAAGSPTPTALCASTVPNDASEPASPTVPTSKRKVRRAGASTKGNASPAVSLATPPSTISKVAAASKTELVLKRLRANRGATVDAIMKDTGWQAHSVRGFLSGTVRKKLGLALTSQVGKDGVRRYSVPGQG